MPVLCGIPHHPQNEVPEYMSERMPQVGGIFIQAEAEVAAINMIFGASAVGARAMTSSSSPGVSLKQEGISYIAAAELPCVIANVQRAGPGLGGIRAAQGDYFQAVKGGVTAITGCWSLPPHQCRNPTTWRWPPSTGPTTTATRR